MITKLARLQVLVFAVVAVIGIGYVGIRYVGLGDGIRGGSYAVGMDLASTGGIFPNAPVTYRGVPVGRVSGVELRGDGVRVWLRIERDVRVPVDLTAVVAQRSAVGEQYVDLRPNSDAGPHLGDGDIIPRDRAGTPLPVEALLAGLDALVRSVGPEDLTAVVTELGRAFDGNEAALRRLIDASSALLADMQRHLPELLALIRDGRTVLATQQESADSIRRWAKGLAQLAATVRAADPDLRRLLAEGPSAAAETIRLLRELEPAVGTLLGNLVTINGIAVRRLAGIEQILVVYPLTIAGGFTVVPGDGTAHLGLVLNMSDPAACNYWRSGSSDCTAAERGAGSGVRGAGNAPRGPGAGSPDQPGAPAPAPGSAGVPAAPISVSGYDPATGIVIGPDGQPVLFGGTGGQYQLAGDQSWKLLLLAGLSP